MANHSIDLGGNQSLTFSTSTNRITTSGFTYNSSGNLTNDTLHAYTYDAENKIRTVDTVAANTFDGEGRRVKKLIGENIRFVYGIGGQLIMEFDGSTGNLIMEYVYGGGSMATIVPGTKGSLLVKYATSDHLGTPRVITGSTAAVISRHDYMPFGEELAPGTGGRTTGMGYGGADGLRKKFTGYEKDSESGLDFAEARHYASTQGRFTAADPLMASASPTHPQSWNRYSYVGNSPLIMTDPSGMMGKHDPVDYSFRLTGAGVYGGAESFPQWDDSWIDMQQRALQPEIAALLDAIAFNAAVLRKMNPCGVTIPTNENDRAMFALLLGEASWPGHGGWNNDDSGQKAAKNPPRTLSDGEVSSEMIFMIFVINNRLEDWKDQQFTGWKDVIERHHKKEMLGYENGKAAVANLSSDGGEQCNRAGIALAAIQSFHEQPFPSGITRYHFWKGIYQIGKRTKVPFITERGHAFRIANTDFSVHENRYRYN